MRIVLIFVTAVLIIEFADGQRKANMTKPVVNLENRKRPPAWNRPPEERRKLSIFPKNPMKFVLTPTTVVKNEDSAKEGLTTKRPLMRKFIMQDRNEKGIWSFAPREPIMKTKIFTVTLAPPRSSDRKAIDEMKYEGSDNVNTVISRAKIEEPSGTNHNLNKGNLIEMVKFKTTDTTATNNLEKVEKKFVGEEFPQITKVNDTQDFHSIQENDNSRSVFNKISKDNITGIQTLNDEDVTVNTNAAKNESENKYVKLNQTAVILNTETSKDFLRSKVVDLNDLKYAIEQNESNSLNMDNEESNNYNTAQTLSFNDLEILLEKIVNSTEYSEADFNEKDPPNSLKNETEATLDDIPTFDVTKPNLFYDVISPSNGEDKNTNLNENVFAGSILHGSQTVANDKKHTVSETNALNGEEEFTENLSDSLVVGWNLENLINLIETENTGIQNNELFNERREIIASNGKEIQTKSKYRLTEKPITNKPQNDEVNSNLTNDTKYEIQTEFPKEIYSNDTDNMNSQEILLEMYESNMSLSSEELTAELIDEVSNVSVTENINLTIVEIPNESFIDSVSGDDILNESISNTWNNYTEELSNEPLINAWNNLTGEDISNESFLNMSGEELSNENSSNEYTIDTSNNFTGEEISNESSSNMAAEEISNESSADKSNNLTEEISNEYTRETSNHLTGEEISNESFSNMAGEDISNELDKSNNLTEEISIESTIKISDHSKREKIFESALIDNSGIIIDEISDKSVESSQEPEILEEALINRFKRSNNIIEEERLPTTVSGFKYTGNEITLDHDLRYRNINA